MRIETNQILMRRILISQTAPNLKELLFTRVDSQRVIIHKAKKRFSLKKFQIQRCKTLERSLNRSKISRKSIKN